MTRKNPALNVSRACAGQYHELKLRSSQWKTLSTPCSKRLRSVGKCVRRYSLMRLWHGTRGLGLGEKGGFSLYIYIYICMINQTLPILARQRYIGEYRRTYLPTKKASERERSKAFPKLYENTKTHRQALQTCAFLSTGISAHVCNKSRGAEPRQRTCSASQGSGVLYGSLGNAE